MNYRHHFHAGNFADVLKHAVLARILEHLKAKPSPFRVIDTHAGAGIYDLEAEAAGRTGEWRQGVGRLTDSLPDPAAEAVLAPWRRALASLSEGGQLYPGSPALIQHLLRAEDRASFNETHPETFAALTQAMGRDGRLVLNRLDGYLAWKAQIPTPERRGLVLVDPPFEAEGEFERLADGLAGMARRWASGIAMLWYPIKDAAAVHRFEVAAKASGLPKLLVLELHVDRARAEGPLAACGLLVVNPPWRLQDDLQALLPALAERLAQGDRTGWRCDWLAGPRD